jgi:hypothetical protein
VTQEALKLALEALEYMSMTAERYVDNRIPEAAITAIKEALAQTQEPVAWIEKDMQCDDFDSDSVTCEKPTIAADGWEWVSLYTIPPQRTWVGLMDEEIKPCWHEACQTDLELTSQLVVYFAKAIEAKLKQKNGFSEEKNT